MQLDGEKKEHKQAMWTSITSVLPDVADQVRMVEEVEAAVVREEECISAA